MTILSLALAALGVGLSAAALYLLAVRLPRLLREVAVSQFDSVTFARNHLDKLVQDAQASLAAVKAGVGEALSEVKEVKLGLPRFSADLTGAVRAFASSVDSRFSDASSKASAILASIVEVQGSLRRLDIESVRAQLSKLSNELTADITALHQSLAALDLPGVRQAVASLQVTTSAMVAKLHEDLAAARTSPAFADSSKLEELLGKLQDVSGHVSVIRQHTAYDAASRIASDAVAYAEQQAAAIPKRGGAKWGWQDKLEAAVGYLVEHHPEVSRDKARSLVEAVLGKDKV